MAGRCGGRGGGCRCAAGGGSAGGARVCAEDEDPTLAGAELVGSVDDTFRVKLLPADDDAAESVVLAGEEEALGPTHDESQSPRYDGVLLRVSSHGCAGLVQF